MGWADGPLMGFDIESTGVDVETDHILTASFVHARPGETLLSETVWMNPGVAIPVGATQIHGITNEKIKQVGEDPATVLESTVLILTAMVNDQTPIVGMNISYDLTILDRNCRRHGVVPLGERLDPIAPVVDIMVLDKLVDPFRKGTGMRKLSALCPLYKVDPGTAHESASDALAAMRIAWRMAKLYPALGRLSAMELHRGQVMWKAEQDKSFARWLKTQKRDATGVDGQWPIRYPVTAAAYADTGSMLWE